MTRPRVVIVDDEPIVNGRRRFGDSLPAELVDHAWVYEDDEREKRDSEYIRSEHESHLRDRRGW